VRLRLLATFGLLLSPCLTAADFTSQIEPILHERCYTCHGPSQQMSGLRLDRREDALKGGYSGAVLVPGDAEASALLVRVRSDEDGFRMPPVGARLTTAQTDAIAEWIAAGAVWPDRQQSSAANARSTNHWSFQPIAKAAPPSVKQQAWVRDPVDRFVLAKLEAEGVAPAPEADRRTLARRAAFDLTGLPLSPEQMAEFVNDQRPDAYEHLVDRLMSSRHYGERQAIPWLDAARYADSDGYERDPLRPHAWRWRDWVINALNADKPFDRFTIEQLAGDLLPDPTLEQKVATGFLRNGIKNREAGTQNDEKRFEETIDRASTVGTVWLGLTVGCAQCHDHKYDPISQKEFYEFFANFNNSVETDINAPLPFQEVSFAQSYAVYRQRRAEIWRRYSTSKLFDEWRAMILKTMDEPGVNTDWDEELTEWRAANDRADWLMLSAESALTEIDIDRRTDWFLRAIGPAFKKDEATQALLKKVQEELAALEADVLPDRTMAYTIQEQREKQTTHIALRGDWKSPGLEVRPGTPAVLNPLDAEAKPARLALAEWIVDPKNPLTARVAVNRVWQQLFGRGLVDSANDFGTQGKEPSHPELLDWLAAAFVEDGWSQKKLLRRIVTSAVYRQSSVARPELAERDPANTWLARQNRLRLPAELVRDNALAVSGLLFGRIGGPSIHPPQPEGVGDLSYSRKDWPEDKGPERYRRGLYIFFRRTSPYPMLVNFDAPDTLTTNVQRERTDTPLQALNLLNDPVFIEAARALALRAYQDSADSDDRVAKMFELALGRLPTAKESERISRFQAAERSRLAEAPEAAEKTAPFVPPDMTRADLAAWTSVARGMLNLDEFVTRE
jgi:hypothetical protein